jgi:hypothetical protein
MVCPITPKPTVTIPTAKPPITSSTVTQGPTTPLEGDCDVNANDCPSGQECVPLRAATHNDFPYNLRGVCKPINYTCAMWQVCVLESTFIDFDTSQALMTQGYCGDWKCGPSIEYLKFNALPRLVSIIETWRVHSLMQAACRSALFLEARSTASHRLYDSLV